MLHAPDAWWRETSEPARTYTDDELDAMHLQWRARIFAAQQGWVLACPARTPQPALPPDLATISDAARTVGAHRSRLNYATLTGEIKTYLPHGAGRPRVSMADVVRWNATRRRRA